MGTGRLGHRKFRAAGAGIVVSVASGTRTNALVLATLLLGACQQSVMVRPVDGPRTSPSRSERGPRADVPMHSVQSGDTLYKISVQYGLDYRDIAAWNQIPPPYTIFPRQQLRLGSESSAMARAPSSDSPRRTRADVSARLGESEARSGPAITALPDTAPAMPQPVSTSQAETAPGAMLSEEPEPVSRSPGNDSPASSASSSPRATANATPPMDRPPTRMDTQSGTMEASPSLPATAANREPVVRPLIPPPAVGTPAPTIASVQSAAPPSDVESAKPSAAGWIWPTPGRVVVTYAGGDPTRQGVDIAGTLGQPVRVARDGEVVYSGAGLIGYGELIIVKHSPELLSAYGHNRVRLVKEGEKLKAGQKIAEMGKNAANRVLLHFEVRKSGKPIDPLPLLPAR